MEQEPEPFTPRENLKCILIILFYVICIIWFLYTLTAWLFANSCGFPFIYHYNCSLLDVLKHEWEWLKGIKLI